MIMMRSITILSQSYHGVTPLFKLSQRGNKSNIETFFNHYTCDNDQNFLSHAYCLKGHFCSLNLEFSAITMQNGNGGDTLEERATVSFLLIGNFRVDRSATVRLP